MQIFYFYIAFLNKRERLKFGSTGLFIDLRFMVPVFKSTGQYFKKISLGCPLLEKLLE